MSAPKNMVKRTAAGTLALAVCLSGGAIALAGAANAADGFKFESRVAGDTRFGTAIEASQRAFANGSDSVVIVNGYATVDGLTASYVAGVFNAPILYTETNDLDGDTKAEIERLKAKNIYIVGGTARISQKLEDSWKKSYTVKRFAGEDRYETAASASTAGGTTKPGKVLLASGEVPADALAVAPLAFAKKYPVVLTRPDTVPAPSAKALKDLGVDERIAVGGTTRIDADTYKDLGADARLSGENRQATAIKVAQHEIDNEGFVKTGFVLVGNTNAAASDALVGAPLAGGSKIPVLFADSDKSDTVDYLKAHAAELTGKSYIFGGEKAVSVGDADAAAKAATGAGVVSQSIKVTGSSAATTTDKKINYTIDGLTAGESVQVVLVQSSLFSDGSYTLDAANRHAVLTPAANVAIDQVNGVAATGLPNTSASFVASGSTATFRVVATSADTFVPVVFKKSDAADVSVDVNLAGAALEKAGFGAKTTFSTPAVAAPAENDSAASFTADVTSINGNSSFVTDDTTETGSLVMRDGDTYKLGAATITKAQFQSVLSEEDEVTVTYVKGADADNPSSFAITDDAFPTQAEADAVVSTPSVKGKVVSVEWTAPVDTTIGGTAFTLQRAVVVSGVVGKYTTVKSGSVSSHDVQTFSESLADGTYVYRIMFAAPSFAGQTVTGIASAPVDVPEIATAVAPEVLRTYTTDNTSAINNLSAGDVFQVVFDRAITTPIEGSAVEVGGETLTFKGADATADGAATFSVNAGAVSVEGASIGAGRVLTVKLLEDPANPVALPSALTDLTGIANSTGPATFTADTDDLNR